MKFNIFSSALAGIKGFADSIVELFQREYPVPYAKNIIVTVTSAGQAVYNIPDMDYFRDFMVVGISTRKQSAADDRYSKNGRKLISLAAMGQCFIRLAQNSAQILEQMPLEHLVHEYNNQAGTYMQLAIDGGFSTQSSTVEFSGTIPAGDVNRDVELIIYYLPKTQICM